MTPRAGPHVAIATCRDVLASPAAAPDDVLLAAALADRGVAAERLAWDDPGVDWAAVDLVVIRSTWNYHHARDAFVAWCERVEDHTTLANPAAVVRANTDKRYLLALADAGVAVVPTWLVEPGDAAMIPADVADAEIVVKPAVSAGAEDTARYAPPAHDAARTHARTLLEAGRAVLVQPYQSRIDTAGETALVFVAGQFSHALRKSPRLPPTQAGVATPPAEETLVVCQPDEAELRAAEAVLAVAVDVPAVGGGHLASPADLLYARVDLVADAAGTPQLLELELTEPSLFLAHAGDHAVAGFADAVAVAVHRA